MQNNRNQLVDAMRGLQIFLVVLVHSWQKSGAAGVMIYQGLMPFFFFFSGYFFAQKELDAGFKAYFFKKVRTLVVPYVFFYWAAFVFWKILDRVHIDGGVQTSLWNATLGFLYGSIHNDLFLVNQVLWFVTCLFTSSLLYWWIRHFLRDRFLLIAVATWIMGVSLAYVTTFNLPWGLSGAPMAIFFMALGALFRNEIAPRLPSFSFAKSFGLFVLFGGIVYLGAAKIGTIQFYLSEYRNPLLFTLIAPFAIAMTPLLVGLLRGRRITQALAFLGANSMVILCVHVHIRKILLGLIVKFCHIDARLLKDDILFVLPFAVLVALLCIPAALLINKYAPALAGKRRTTEH